MSKRNFTIDELNDYDLYEGSDSVRFYEGLGAGRWSETFEVVFLADDGKHYLVHVEEGLTEYQDYYGDERYPDRNYRERTVLCAEVELYDQVVTTTQWRNVKVTGS